MYTMKLLKASELPSYAEMTFPRFRERLRDPLVIAVGATVDGKPVGLGLAELPRYTDQAEVLSLFVGAEYRKDGVGAALMSRLQDELVARGVTRVRLSYAKDKPGTAAVERILERCGWEPPEPHMYIGKADRRVASAPWTASPMPAGLTVFPWHTLSEEDRRAIQQRQMDGPWYPGVLSPFVEESSIDPVTSLGLRDANGVVGWMVNHRIGGGTIRYSSLFVDGGIRDKGCGVALCSAAILRQDWENTPYALFAVMADNSRMMGATLRNLAPYLISLVETRQSTRLLGSSQA